MEIELIDTANIIANSPTTSTKNIKNQDLNNTSLNITTAINSIEIVNKTSIELNNNNKIRKNINSSNKIVKKTKKKMIKTASQKYELELQELSNSFLLQNILVEYLEIKSNFIGKLLFFLLTKSFSIDFTFFIKFSDETSTESRLQFANLITLFYLFINFKLFSHNSFICTLISRGEIFRNLTNDDYKDIMSVPASGIGSVKNPQSVQSLTHYQSHDSRKSIDFVTSSDHHLQHQKSVDSVSATADVFADESMVHNDVTQNIPTSTNQISKLTNIVLNLPLPQNDAYQHERNQRSIILYGFGTKR
jgi:hypothetical protein